MGGDVIFSGGKAYTLIGGREIPDYFGIESRIKSLIPAQATSQATTSSGIYSNPFGTATSGTQMGTLQPYVNRMTQNASNALYGGLLGYSPQSMVAGDAGGTPQNSTVPQFNIPSALSQYGNGLNFTGFGKRSWMGGNNGS